MGEDLASAIRAARLELGLTQAQVAQRAGITASYLSRIESAAWERGGPWPADAVLSALARALGVSSTELIRLRAEARGSSVSSQPAALARANGRVPYAVSMGAAEVDAAACRLVERNPRRGLFRLVQVPVRDGPAGQPTSGAGTYVDRLSDRVAESKETLLYQVGVPPISRGDPRQSTVDGILTHNARRRISFSNPLVMDVLIGEHEALIALPDRGGTPHLGACLVVDDPDFVAALRQWYDEWIWDPPAGPTEVLDEVATPVCT